MLSDNPTIADAVLPRSELLALAHDLADAAATKIRPHFRRTKSVENKDRGTGFDPVTVADKAAERAMRTLIRRRFPRHGILGEEYAAFASTSRYRWVLDPIDGTRAFICGFPLWGVLIGLLDGDEPLLGMMDQPYTGERFWAAGAKAQMRRADGKTQTLKTRPCRRLQDAVLVSTAPDMFKSAAEQSAFGLCVTARQRT